jgi:exoribonuclease II
MFFINNHSINKQEFNNMDIEVIMNHRVKAERIIEETMRANGIPAVDYLVEEFLSFYDYNGLAATINNVSSYAKTVLNRDKEQYYLRFHTVFY